MHTLVTLWNHHGCWSSDTFDYKNDRFIFVLECPLLLPKVCHSVMRRSAKEPSGRYTQRGRESVWNSKIPISPFIIESSAITWYCSSPRSKQPLNRATATSPYPCFSIKSVSSLTEFLTFPLVALISIWTDFCEGFLLWEKENQVWKTFMAFPLAPRY